MGVRITGVDALRIMLERDGDAARRASLIAMDEKADELVFEAQKNAPVDKYNLEEAIVRTNAREGGATRQIRDPVTGRFKAYTVEVYVKDHVIDKETGKSVNVAQYALIMEESDRAGHGSPENDMKRARGGDPGRKYMQRAYDTVDPTVIPAMLKKVRESL